MLKKSRLWRDVMVLASGRDLQWQEFVANNATAAILSGGAVTAATGTNCPAYWFSGPSTLILGRNPRPGSDPTTATIARWDIAVDQGAIASMQRAFVVIDCIRNFGGLHTRRKDAWAWIWLNAQCVDAFTLCVRPVGHSDYFHRPPVPEFPRCLAFADYQTIYAWLIPRHALANQANQELQVKIDPEVRWDIGHVSIVIANVNGQSSTTFFKSCRISGRIHGGSSCFRVVQGRTACAALPSCSAQNGASLEAAWPAALLRRPRNRTCCATISVR